MAHRLFIHRLWNVTVKEIHCFAASTSSYKNGIFFTSASNSITRVSHRRSSFSVQDKDDFTERVINSKLPVLIDFHAQWVLQGGKAVEPIERESTLNGQVVFFTLYYAHLCGNFIVTLLGTSIAEYRFYLAWYSTVIVVFHYTIVPIRWDADGFS